VAHKGGDIRDTNASAGAPVTLKAPEINVIAQGRVGVASNALEVEVGSGGHANFVTGATDAFINTVPGGESVTNVVGSSPVLSAFQSLGFFLNTLSQVAIGRTVGLETTGLETTGLGELVYVDEGLFLLPQPYAQPIQATLLPALMDPDLPAHLRPDDPDDEDAWQAFYSGVLKSYAQSRYPLPEGASEAERAAVAEKSDREWNSLVAYFQNVRQRERATLLSASPGTGTGG
jgi:hypothetical protein